METSLCHKALPPNQRLYTPRLLASMAQLYIFDVDPETDIIITRGREVVTEIHMSPVTLRLTSLPCWPTNLLESHSKP